MLLMCSDGLSGVIPDQPMRGITDSLETILREGTDDLNATRDRLMKAAERNDWYDNVTVLLCSINGKGLPAMPGRNTASGSFKPRLSPGRVGLIVFVTVLVIGAIALAIKYFTGSDTPQFTASPDDSTQVVSSTPIGNDEEEFFTPEAVSEIEIENNDSTGKNSDNTRLATPQEISATLSQATQDWRNRCIQNLENVVCPNDTWRQHINSKIDEIKDAEDTNGNPDFYYNMSLKYQRGSEIYNNLQNILDNHSTDLDESVKTEINNFLNLLSTEIYRLGLEYINKRYERIENSLSKADIN